MTNQGGHTYTVGSANGFAPDMLVYVRHPGGMGQFSFVESAAGTSIRLVDGADVDYPVGSGLYAVDERAYRIDTSGAAPRLMLTVNRGTPQAFAAGMRDLQVRYELAQNCPPCDVVDLPADDAAWRLVNQVLVTSTVETVGAVRPEDQVSVTETTRAKPRNLLP
jgi:hypothetical protein